MQKLSNSALNKICWKDLIAGNSKIVIKLNFEIINRTVPKLLEVYIMYDEVETLY